MKLFEISCKGTFTRAGRGIFADRLLDSMPWLRVVEETELETLADARPFEEALARPATRERHAGVLRRALNRPRESANPSAVAALEKSVRSYESGHARLEAVRGRARGAAIESGDEVLARQSYLDVEPAGSQPGLELRRES